MVSRSKLVAVLLFWLVTTHTSPAVEYLSFEDAMRLAFPNSGKVERFKPTLSEAEQKKVVTAAKSSARASLGGIYVGHSEGKIDGIAIVDHVIGRTEYITWLCILAADGTVRRLEVMTYREPYGSEIRDQRFLKQFTGKNATSPLRVGHEVSNIGGATLSVNALTDRVRFMLHLHAVSLQESIPAWLAGRESPPAPKPNSTNNEPVTRPVGESALTIQAQPNLPATQHDAALSAAEALDTKLNAWRENAELASLNRAHHAEVSAELFSALRLAKEGFEKTDQTFDPTIYPLLQCWIRARERGTPPTDEELSQARSAIGFGQVVLDPSKNTVTMPDHVALDLSGVNKGLIVDKAGSTLELTDKQSVLISHGGSSWLALGTPDPVLHRVAIRNPADPSSIAFTVALRPGQGLGCASSAGRTLRVGDKTYSHLIDPRSGQPAALNRAAAVISSNATIADLLDTALCILDISDGLRVVKAFPDTEAALWDGKQWHYTAGWPR